MSALAKRDGDKAPATAGQQSRSTSRSANAKRRVYTRRELTAGSRFYLICLENNWLHLAGVPWRKRWRMWSDVRDGSIIVEYE